MNNYRQQLDNLFSKAQQASAGTSLLSEDDIRNLLADSVPAQQPVTHKPGVQSMIIAGTATVLASLITAGTLFFSQSDTPTQQQDHSRTTVQSVSPAQVPATIATGTATAVQVTPVQTAPAAQRRSKPVHTIDPAPEALQPLDIRGVRTLDLTDKELQQLGIEHRGDTLAIYQRRDNGGIMYMAMYPELTINPAIQHTPSFPVLSQSHLRMVTDDRGNRRLTQFDDEDEETMAKAPTTPFTFVSRDGNDPDKVKIIEVHGSGAAQKVVQREATEQEAQEFIASEDRQKELAMEIDDNIRANRWIGIRVSGTRMYTEQDSLQRRWRNHYILWYEPTPEVLAALPERYRADIERELQPSDAATSVEPTEGGFIGLWQTRSGAITASSVAPNPSTDGTVQVQYTLSAPRDVFMKLRTITGAVLMTLPAQRNKPAGTWTETISTGAVAPGMYLLSIETNNGEYSVQRLIVE